VFKKVQQNCVPPAVSKNVIGVNLILLQVGSTSLTGSLLKLKKPKNRSKIPILVMSKSLCDVTRAPNLYDVNVRRTKW
jgi:hypothetical protein